MRHEPFTRSRDPPVRVAASTLQAIDYLLKLGDPARLQRFLNGRSKGELKAIQQYIDEKAKRRAADV